MWAPSEQRRKLFKVLNEDFALITEEQSMPIDERKCDIEIVGEPLDVIYHGIGFRKSRN